MLTLLQSQEYTRAKTLGKFFAANDTITPTFAPFDDEVDKFNLNVGLFDDLIPNKDNVSTVFTTEKDGFQHATATGLAAVGKKTRSYAITNGLTELAGQMNFTADDVMNKKDADVLGFAQSVQTLVTPLLAVTAFGPYNITAATLDAIITNATSFNGLIGQAKGTASLNTAANADINGVIDDIHVNIDHFGLLVDEFAVPFPDFVTGYFINSAREETGVHHSGIKGTVTSKATGLPLENITITLSAEGKATKIAVTSLTGVYSLIGLRAGDYTMTVSGEGVVTQTSIQHIFKGKVLEVDFVM
jgi:hypothetical protein